MFWQEDFRNLYWDLHKVDAVVKLEGSFSSGHVAEPLGRNSKKNSWLSVKLPPEGDRWRVLLLNESSPQRREQAPVFPACSRKTYCEGRTSEVTETAFLRSSPFQGIAIDALSQKIRSQDRVLFKRLDAGTSGFAWFQTYTLESSLIEMICRPSAVKDADT